MFTRFDVSLTIGAALAVILALSFAPPAAAQDKVFVMKLSTATLNDTQHEWLKRFAAMVEKDSGGKIKGEVYPASQLGPIPRQIEGVQFGSVQGWMGPPEFLVGIDKRFESLSAPGLFSSYEQDVKTLMDPAVQKLFFEVGSNKGVEGIALAPIGPSSMAMRKEPKSFADLKNQKIRVLASPFQLELVRRMGASPVAMTLGDVLPGLQQGAIDGALATITVFTTFQYVDVAKYVIENEQPYLNSLMIISKKWMATLPADLQKIVRDDAAKTTAGILAWDKDYFFKQRDVWKDKGGVLITPPKADLDAMNAKLASIGDDLSKDNAELNAAVKLVFEAAKKHK